MSEHPAYCAVTALSPAAARRGQIREGRSMHLIPEPFTTTAGRITPEYFTVHRVRTLCGREVAPGTVWAPTAWWTSHRLARTHQTGHCLACLDRDTRPYPAAAEDPR